MEVFYIELGAEVYHESLPHVAGMEECVFLVHGTLKMMIGGKELITRRKQKIYELVQVSERCYYINCPAKMGVYAAVAGNTGKQ